jgi:uncharacterized integral membrane protein
MTNVDGKGGDAGRRVNAKVILISLVVALLLLFALLNTHDVGVDWIFDTVNVPMILVIAVSALLGFAIGFLVRVHLEKE